MTSTKPPRPPQNKSLAAIAIIDNYDSFTYNLVQYLAQLGANVVVHRNDAITVEELQENYDRGALAGILLSPGPGTPADSGVCLDVIRTAAEGVLPVPLLGVCLGHQAIAAVFGAVVQRAPELLHGKTSDVHHTGEGVLAGMPNPFIATRYHSLAVVEETLPSELEVTAHTASRVVMALKHRTLPIEGVQFHPEAILTQAGHRMLATWLEHCGHPDAGAAATPLVAEADARQQATLFRVGRG